MLASILDRSSWVSGPDHLSIARCLLLSLPKDSIGCMESGVWSVDGIKWTGREGRDERLIKGRLVSI
jgi:hypothetical protein